MFELIGRARRRARGEQGFTLVEMTITLSLLLVVLAVFFGVLVSVQNAVARQGGRSDSNDQARLAVEELDRQIRSGDVVYDPCSATAMQPFTAQSSDVKLCQALVIYTQTKAGTGNPNQCVEWMIDPAGQLVERTWDVEWQDEAGASGYTGWRDVANNVVNLSTSTSAFQLLSGPAYGSGLSRAVTIDVVTRDNAFQGNAVSIQDTVTARNTQYGYPANVCSSPPPYPSSYPTG